MIKFSENIDIIDRKVYNIVINCEMRGGELWYDFIDSYYIGICNKSGYGLY